MFVDAIPIAIVSYTIGQVGASSKLKSESLLFSQGLGKLFGAKHGYSVPPNQVYLVVGIVMMTVSQIVTDSDCEILEVTH